MAPKTKPWNACDFMLLFGLLASIITLICTCTLVWNPYLQTSSFYWANCRVDDMIYLSYQTCNKQPSDDCIPPNSTLPPSWITRSTTAVYSSSSATPSATSLASTPAMTSATSSTAMTSATSSTVTDSETEVVTTEQHTTSAEALPLDTLEELNVMRRRRKRATGDTCVSFPCVAVKVTFLNPYSLASGKAQLWNKYSDLTQYSACSINSCDNDNEENAQNVEDFTNVMRNYWLNSIPFYCYYNYKDYTQVLYHVNGSYAAAVSSIFWPIVGLIGFFVGFVMYRFRGCTNKSSRNPPPSYDASYSVGNQGTGQVSFVGVGGMEYNYATGVVNPVASSDGEKNPATLGQEMGGARPDATTPPPMGLDLPPAYLSISPEGQYSFPPVTRMPPVPAGSTESGAAGYVDPFNENTEHDKY